MKKFIIILSIIIVILSINKQEKIIIPQEAIRFRIIANSNSISDQNIKKEIVNNLSKELLSNNFNNINEARKYIKNNLSTFKNISESTLKKYNNEKVDISYGNNYFPKKEFKGITYQEGMYESLVITIGDGVGNNFWCVLYPPLCLIDEDTNEYPSLIKELIDKYF